MSIDLSWRRSRMGLLAFVLALSCGRGEEAGTPWDAAAFRQASAVQAAPDGVPVLDGVRALCFQGPPWNGSPTQVFAYLALPGDATPENKVPGIVLIHGAGGTASAEWAKMWAAHGYAAISFDTEGQLPAARKPWPRNPSGGPRRGPVTDVRKPDEAQWMYHAVADGMLAHSLLASLPEVDPQRIGLSGISWGGVVACNVAAADARFRFAIPVYGCGFISGSGDGDGSLFVGVPSKKAPDQTLPVEAIDAWRKRWDPANYLSRAAMPMLWVGGATDFAFTPRARQLSYSAAPGTRAVTLFPLLDHSEGAGREPAEIFAFADSVAKGGPALIEVAGHGVADGAAWASWKLGTPVRSASFLFTRDTGRWQDRRWETVAAKPGADRVTAAIPEGASAWYFNLVDDRGLTVSSPHEAAPRP